MSDKTDTYPEEHLAMFEENLPVNPLPFLLKITELIRMHGTAVVKSDRIKAILWIVMAQSYGQMASIDLCEEWERLRQVFKT